MLAVSQLKTTIYSTTHTCSAQGRGLGATEPGGPDSRQFPFSIHKRVTFQSRMLLHLGVGVAENVSAPCPEPLALPCRHSQNPL